MKLGDLYSAKSEYVDVGELEYPLGFVRRLNFLFMFDVGALYYRATTLNLVFVCFIGFLVSYLLKVVGIKWCPLSFCGSLLIWTITMTFS